MKKNIRKKSKTKKIASSITKMYDFKASALIDLYLETLFYLTS